jgi:hypothetical protein
MQTMVEDKVRRATSLFPAAAVCFAAALCALPGVVSAQQPLPPSPANAPPASAAPAAIPRPEDLEPGVDTTRATAAPAAAAPETGTTAAPAAAPPSVPRSSTALPATASGPAAAAKAPGKGATAKTSAAKADRIELDTTDITGNRELPKVLYIVPWKRSDLGDIVGRPVNSLLDEVLQPLDRDVFQRENRYYDALKPSQDAPKPGAAQGSENKP